jgi:hypothetical protein
MLATGDPSRYLIKSDSKVVGNTYTYYLEQYLASHHVDEIILGESAYAEWSGYLSFLHESPLHIGGIWLYRTSAFLDSSLPGQVVPGDPIQRAYTLEAARWDDSTHLLEVPTPTQGIAVETLRDSFAGGHYSATISVTSAASGPVAKAYILVEGKSTATALLPTGHTRIDFDVPGDRSTIQIQIASLGTAQFFIGDTVLAPTS